MSRSAHGCIAIGSTPSIRPAVYSASPVSTSLRTQGERSAFGVITSTNHCRPANPSLILATKLPDAMPVLSTHTSAPAASRSSTRRSVNTSSLGCGDRVEGWRVTSLLAHVSTQRPQNRAGKLSLHPARQYRHVFSAAVPCHPPRWCCRWHSGQSNLTVCSCPETMTGAGWCARFSTRLSRWGWWTTSWVADCPQCWQDPPASARSVWRCSELRPPAQPVHGTACTSCPGPVAQRGIAAGGLVPDMHVFGALVYAGVQRFRARVRIDSVVCPHHALQRAALFAGQVLGR